MLSTAWKKLSVVRAYARLMVLLHLRPFLSQAYLFVVVDGGWRVQASAMFV